MKYFIMLSVALAVHIARADSPLEDQFDWLIDTWVQKNDESSIIEEWRRVSDTILQGRGLLIQNEGSDKKTTETILLVQIDGEVFYIAKAAQNDLPVSFRMVSISDQNAVFENLDHDFPKRIEYSLNSNGDLEAIVSDGGDRGFSLLFTRQDVAIQSVE
jgi:hypothetical protein